MLPFRALRERTPAWSRRVPSAAALAAGALIAFSTTAAGARAGTAAPVASPAASPAATQAPAVRLSLPAPVKEVFANGLRVIAMEDHSAPVVSVQVWYHVGSKNETKGHTGLAHLFEHLMFRGTATRPPGAFDTALDAVGGVNNAFTTEDVTAYYESVPSDALDLALDLEADRMRNLKLTPPILDAEREVVKEEKRLRLDNDPLGKTMEAFRALAYTTHPYAWTPAGSIRDLDAVTVPEAQAFYDRWYRPDNAVLVIVGDVPTADAIADAHRRFDAVAPAAAIAGAAVLPRAAIPAEPPQTAMRAETLALDTQLPQIVGGYHIPAVDSADTAPLEVLGALFSNGESSLLYRRLVKEQKLAVFAAGWANTFEDPGLFLVVAGYLPSTDGAKVRDAMLGEIELVARDGVTAHDVQKAKNQLLASHVFGLETVEGKGMSLGGAETIQGDYRKFLDETTKYDRVTPADVRRVARKYLVRSNLTLVTLEPKREAGGAE